MSESDQASFGELLFGLLPFKRTDTASPGPRRYINSMTGLQPELHRKSEQGCGHCLDMVSHSCEHMSELRSVCKTNSSVKLGD